VRSKGRTAAPGYDTLSKQHDDNRTQALLLINDRSRSSRALITPVWQVQGDLSDCHWRAVMDQEEERHWVRVGRETLVTVRSRERCVDETEAKGA